LLLFILASPLGAVAVEHPATLAQGRELRLQPPPKVPRLLIHIPARGFAAAGALLLLPAAQGQGVLH
jgi:hypothetical protein